MTAMLEPSSLALLTLAGVLALFITGAARYDVVALVALGAVSALGLAPPERLFDGFGHPAVITVAAVLILSGVMSRAGVVEIIASKLEPLTKNQAAHLLVLCGVVAALSAFINNVGALALMMPVALATARKRQRNPSILLMPLAFAAILGGMTTLIGTPPNIIIASLRAESAGEAFGLFAFTPVGAPTALAGVAFVALIGWRLLPKDRQAANAEEALFSVGGYVAELSIGEGGDLIGKPIREAGKLQAEGVRIVAVLRKEPAGEGEKPKAIRLPALPWRVLRAGDAVIVEAEPDALTAAIDAHGLTVAGAGEDRRFNVAQDLDWSDAAMVEAVVSERSPLVGRSARLLDRLSGERVTLIALSRQGAPIRRRLADETFRAGDVALLQGDADAINDLMERFQLWPLASRGLSAAGRPKRAPLIATALFIGAILASVAGLLPIAAALTIAVVGAVVTGLTPARRLYDDVDWSVVVLLGAMFPLGLALESTGATALLAGKITSLAASFSLPDWAVLTLVLLVTMGLSDVINNAATALLMAPIAVEIATRLEANSDAFLMAVAIGASCAFLTPIGHQCNTLVLGPGGYKFTDYWRMGLPLEVVIAAVAVPMLLVVWPL